MSLHSCTIMCLTTNTSQGITTSLHTRAQPLFRAGHPWATPLTLRVNTTQRPPTPVSTRHLSTPPPTSRTTTPLLQPLNLTLSQSQPLTPLPQLLQGPGSVSRSRQHSLSPTHKQGGRLNRPTHHPHLVSMCHAPHLRIRQVRRGGTLHIPFHKLRICTLRQGTRGTAQGLGEGSTRFQCLREGWKIIQQGQGLHRVLFINPAR